MKEGIKFGLGCMVGAGIGALMMGVCIDVYESVARYDKPKENGRKEEEES